MTRRYHKIQYIFLNWALKEVTPNWENAGIIFNTMTVYITQVP